MYENRAMKFDEVVPRRGENKCGRTMEGMIYCKHICNCHNASSLYHCYMLVNEKTRKIKLKCSKGHEQAIFTK
jgi:hypothetical protein